MCSVVMCSVALWRVCSLCAAAHAKCSVLVRWRLQKIVGATFNGHASQMAALRVIGVAPGNELVIASSTRVETLRPKSTIKKSFEVQAVFGPESSNDQLCTDFIAPNVCAALAAGRSAYVLSLGAEQSGKSSTLRGTPESAGLALLALGDVYAMLDEERSSAESLVTISAVCCAIVPAQGETPLQGKQPVREVLIDALGPAKQPAAGLNVREHADGLPHEAPFFAEGLREVVAPSAADAEALVRGAIARCAEEEAGPALRVHLLLSLTVRQKRRAAEGDAERTCRVSFVDIAGVPRPRSAAAAPAGRGGGRAVAGRAGGRGAAGRGGGAGGAGEDPFVKAVYRILDTLQDVRPGGHVPYRDSKLTRLIASGLGGGALALPVLHLRADRFEEAEAVLTLCPKLPKLSASAALPKAAKTAAAVDPDGWWSPLAEYRSAEERVVALAAALDLERSGLVSSGIALDHNSSDELLALQEALLLSERLQHRLASWERLRSPDSVEPPVDVLLEQAQREAAPAAALRELPPQSAAEAIDVSRLRLLKSKAGASSLTAGGGFGRALPRTPL